MRLHNTKHKAPLFARAARAAHPATCSSASPPSAPPPCRRAARAPSAGPPPPAAAPPPPPRAGRRCARQPRPTRPTRASPSSSTATASSSRLVRARARACACVWSACTWWSAAADLPCAYTKHGYASLPFYWAPIGGEGTGRLIHFFFFFGGRRDECSRALSSRQTRRHTRSTPSFPPVTRAHPRVDLSPVPSS
jgi:hypothetical protein